MTETPKVYTMTPSERRAAYVRMLERMLASAERLDAISKGRVTRKQQAILDASTDAIRRKLELARANADPDENSASVDLAAWMARRA